MVDRIVTYMGASFPFFSASNTNLHLLWHEGHLLVQPPVEVHQPRHDGVLQHEGGMSVTNKNPSSDVTHFARFTGFEAHTLQKLIIYKSILSRIFCLPHRNKIPLSGLSHGY